MERRHLAEVQIQGSNPCAGASIRFTYFDFEDSGFFYSFDSAGLGFYLRETPWLLERNLSKMTDEYTEAAQKLFDAYSNIIGKAAEGIVEKDENITFEDGEIKEFDGEEEEINELIKEYRNVMGDVAVNLAKQNLEDINPEITEK